MKLLRLSLQTDLKNWFNMGLVAILLSVQSVATTAQNCITSPVVTCPPIFFGCLGDDLAPDALGWATAVPGDANCPQPVITYRDTTTSTDICGSGMIVKRLWTARYPDNTNPWLFAECTQVLVLTDSEDPVITNCPPDVVVGTDASCRAIVRWDQPSASDDCGILGFTSNFGSGSAFYPGVTTVTYTATDNCGNMTTCSFTVTVQEACCNDTPSLSIPSDYTGCPGSSIDPSITGSASGTLTGNNCGSPTISYADVIINNGDCSGETLIQRTWTAVNPNNTNATSSGIQWITLTDNNSPVIMNCPSDISIVSNANCEAVVTWPTPTASDDCGISSFTSSHNSGATFSSGETVVTYTAVDHCGNTSTCSFKVTVISNCCDGTPDLQLPANYLGCPNTSTAPSITGTATGTISGNGCPTPTITYADEVISDGDCGLTIRRTWTATNPNFPAQSTSGIQLITTEDNNSPVIMNCPSDISIVTGPNCQAIVTWSAPTASDNCGIASFTSNFTPGVALSPGETEVVYTATDHCGNVSSCSFKITVISNCCDGAPLLQLPPNYSGCPGSSSDPAVTGVAVAMIPGTGCATPLITFSDEVTVDSDCGQLIRRTWIATNPNYTDQVTYADQLISLQDNIAPVIVGCPSDITVVSNADCYAIVNFAEPTATDNCGVISFANDRPTGSGSRFELGTTTITYTAQDACGNVATCSFDIHVIGNCCDDDLVISCPNDYSGCPGSSIDPSVTGMATANASADCSATITFYDVVTSQTGCFGSQVIDRYWVASRSNGSESDTCIQRITLMDDEAPTITSCVPDVTLSYEDRSYTWADPIVEDNCSTEISYNFPKGTTFPVGTTTVLVTIKDNCDNSATCRFTVTVLPQNNGAGLVVNCPADMTITCGDQGGHVPLPDVETDCAMCDEGEIPGFVYMGSRDGHSYYCSKDKMTWQDAQAFSMASGGHLAVINSAGENTFLANILQTSSAYIGLSDHINEGAFTWVDGSPLTYSKWYPGQPNDYNHSQDYVELLRSGYWNDQYNTKKLEFIMEITCLSITQTEGPQYLSDVTQNTTVSFLIEDACGNVDSCSYDISVSSDVSLTCAGDIEIETSEDKVVAYFDPPVFVTCCTSCVGGGDIPGFDFLGEREGSYYYLSQWRDIWHNANKTAREVGGHLAIIDDAGENAFLASRIPYNIAFIGLSDHAEEGVWRNVNGHEQQFFNWRSDNPNNYEGVQHYVELEPSGKWNDNRASYKRKYIIEVSGCGSVKQVGGIPSGGYFPVGTTKVGFEAKDDCGNSRTCFFDVQVSSIVDIQPDYCDSYGRNSSRAHIHQVKLGDFEHTSGDNGGYLDYAEGCAPLKAGEKFRLTITPGWGSYRYAAYYKIYVDFNRDGDFSDQGEYMGKARSSNTITGSIGIPHGTPPGEMTMRVVMSLTGYPEPCGANYYGETEDYCISIAETTSNQAPGKVTGLKSNIGEVTFTEIRDQISPHQPAVYPNPARDYINLISDEVPITTLNIIGLDGKIVKQINQPSGKIDVSDLSSGLYLIRMIDDAGLDITERIVIE